MKPVVVHRLKYYGNPERLKWAMEFEERKRRLKVPCTDIHSLTVAALQRQFGIAEHTAQRDLAGLRAYRQAVFAQELVTSTSRLYNDLRRIAQKAEAEKQYQAAVAAHREIARITGAYAALQVQVEHTVTHGPDVQQQLRAIMGALTPEQRAAGEVFLAGIEQAKQEGRLQLPSGDEDDDEAPDDAAEDAEIVVDQNDE
jgi:hypothetical protein